MKWMAGALLGFVLLPNIVIAQEVHQELTETLKAKVLNIISEEEVELYGTGAVETVQVVEAELTSGNRAGEVVRFENDLVQLGVGDKIFLNYQSSIDGTEYYIFKDADRAVPVYALAIFFIALLIVFAGWQGVRAILSLLLSVGAILFVLVPALLAGYNPALTSLVVAGIVLAVVLFGTHGWNARTGIAFFGTFSAVLITCVLAWWWVSWMRLTGFGHDASVYLNFATGGQLDFAGLLLGSIIIGILGVLDDVSITQASVVQELKATDHSLRKGQLYKKAIRVGKDHVGSLVNTLALAYVGAALPLVLLMSQGSSSFISVMNQEVVAAEYLRILIGSLGLVLAVPLTTLIAAWWFDEREVHSDDCCDHGHSHGHSH